MSKTSGSRIGIEIANSTTLTINKANTKNVDCSKLPMDGKDLHQKALDRCNCLVAQYLRWKMDNLRKSSRSQASALIFTAAIPVVLLLPRQYVDIISAAFSAIAAISTRIPTKPRAIWSNLVKRVEGLVTLDVTEWRTELQRPDERSH